MRKSSSFAIERERLLTLYVHKKSKQIQSNCSNKQNFIIIYLKIKIISLLSVDSVDSSDRTNIKLEKNISQLISVSHLLKWVKKIRRVKEIVCALWCFSWWCFAMNFSIYRRMLDNHMFEFSLGEFFVLKNIFLILQTEEKICSASSFFIPINNY